MSYKIQQTNQTNESKTCNTVKQNSHSIVQESYYADTAYTAEKLDALGCTLGIGSFGYNERYRRQLTFPKGRVCPHILPQHNTSILDLFSKICAIDVFHEHSEQKYQDEIGDNKIWEELTQPSGKSPKELWQFTKWIFLIVFIMSIIVFVPVTFLSFREIISEPKLFLIPVTSLLLFYVARYMEKISIIKDKIKFNRRTGMVSIPRWGKPPFRRPFYEFIPYYYYWSGGNSMLVNFSTYLGHRHYPIGIAINGIDYNSAFAKWSFLQLFMDVSLPLPDIPEFEIYRHLDPTTADYDNKTGRPVRYWRDMNYYKAKKFYQNESERLDQFDAKNLYSWCTLSDNYIQWSHLIELEPVKNSYEEIDERFD